MSSVGNLDTMTITKVAGYYKAILRPSVNGNAIGVEVFFMSILGILMSSKIAQDHRDPLKSRFQPPMRGRKPSPRGSVRVIQSGFSPPAGSPFPTRSNAERREKERRNLAVSLPSISLPSLCHECLVEIVVLTAFVVVLMQGDVQQFSGCHLVFEVSWGATVTQKFQGIIGGFGRSIEGMMSL